MSDEEKIKQGTEEVREGLKTLDEALATPPIEEPPPPPPVDEEPPPVVPPPALSAGVLISPIDIAALPMSGAGWAAVEKAARGSWGSPKLSDLNSLHDVYTLAGALAAVRLGDDALRAKTIAACQAAVGTEAGSRSLEVSRNIQCYVFAADIIGWRDEAWMDWLGKLRARTFDGKTIISTHDERPNNWGTHAGAARIAIARYLGDAPDLAKAAKVFQGWLGDRSAYAGFSYGELDWQADPSKPVGINPKGATKQGLNIDGVLPDDQRRGGGFTTSPPKEGYVHEALQGALVQAVMLSRAGYPAWEWSDKALLRAYEWLHKVNNNPAVGDDAGYPHIVNKAYGSNYPAATPAPMGKNLGFADWLFSGG